MKKLLLVTTAIAGVAFMSAPASAAVKLDLGGFFRGYGVFANNDVTAADEHNFEFRRDTELQATGETTLDNGLTVGAHTELKLASGAAAGTTTVDTDEVYAYASGGWGRVNFGVEDGAAYLLQVAAPSADSNIDGLRTNISAITTGTIADAGYAQADFGGPGNGTDRLTYLTPKFNGFQAGASYAPHSGVVTNIADMGVDGDTDFKNLWEVGARYDGEFEGFGISAGAGYSDSDVEVSGAPVAGNTDGIKSWNGGLTISAQGFSLGGAYKESKTDIATVENKLKTWVVGGAYDNGPYHAGASYLDSKLDDSAAGSDAELEKYTVGGGYAFGPGMTFRGAVAWGNTAEAAAADTDFTQVTIGTDIQF